MLYKTVAIREDGDSTAWGHIFYGSDESTLCGVALPEAVLTTRDTVANPYVGRVSASCAACVSLWEGKPCTGS